MTKNQKDKCEICGKKLEYASNQKEYKNLDCYFCNNPFHTNIYCPNGHYICDQCHSKTPIRIIEDFCQNTDIKDPFIIAEKIMAHPKFKMYGPEHHALTPAAILTALKNNDIRKPNGMLITLADIFEGISRGSKIPGGYCGFYGACGAGIGSGIAISVFTGANPSENIPRSLANEMTSRSLNKISDDLEHCCKRSVRLSISEALKFLKEKFEIDLDYEPISCGFSSLNNKCEKLKCPIN
ncbi:MAG: radical SAM protein [Candidatus Lokiarchaeota archaeon]|nr:radical SAM protein [Candidatus Lokiarchaeota archaeon]